MSYRIGLDATGRPSLLADAKPVGPRPELATLFAQPARRQRANLSFDAARDGTDLDNHWAFADGLDPDNSHAQGVRQKLVRRSRYEQGSNAFYGGIIDTHCNMLVGVGPTLRMLTGNRDFNQLVEREFYKWAQQTQLRRKLWAIAHAVTGDGESFAILQTNPALPGVQLDVMPIECDMVQSAFGTFSNNEADGIGFDDYNNITHYSILPYHPGGNRMASIGTDAVPVPAGNVVHWFKLKRPGAHHGIPAMTAGMTVGALARRHREATVTAAETAASIGAMLTTNLGPAGSDEPDPVAPFSSVEFARRMLMVAPMGWDAKQMKGEHPNAQYAEFHRTLLTELSRGISMPYNAAACDSSTYSFASGKLDTLCYRAALDVERQDCNDLVLDPIFASWFREWTILNNKDFVPDHQWDWPLHPVIDAVAEANAIDTKLKNGTLQLRQAYSDQGEDLEDQLSIMAEDTFGDATPENIDKCRKIIRLLNTPQQSMPFVAQLLGLEMPAQSQQPQPIGAAA